MVITCHLVMTIFIIETFEYRAILLTYPAYWKEILFSVMFLSKHYNCICRIFAADSYNWIRIWCVDFNENSALFSASLNLFSKQTCSSLGYNTIHSMFSLGQESSFCSHLRKWFLKQQKQPKSLLHIKGAPYTIRCKISSHDTPNISHQINLFCI